MRLLVPTIQRDRWCGITPTMPALIGLLGEQGSKQHTAIVRGKQALQFIAPRLDVIELLEPCVQINRNKINHYIFLKFRCLNY